MADERKDRGADRARGDKHSYPSRDGEKKPHASRSGERRPSVKRDGGRSSASRDGDKSYAPRDGERKPYPAREGEKPHRRHDGERKPYAARDGERKPYAARDGERKPYPTRDGERKPFVPRDGDRKPYPKRDGEKRPFPRRDGDNNPPAPRTGERKTYAHREGDRPFPPRDAEKRPYARRDGDRPHPGRDGGKRPYLTRDGDRKPYAKRTDDREAREPRIAAPEIPEDVTARDLNGPARNELKTLSKDNAEYVARHLAMAARLIEDDPALAHQHALAASRSAGRIAVVRETLAITAYATGDYALALRELRTYRRISGNDDQIALMVDSERGVGRPDRALEVGRAVDRAELPAAVRVELAIAMSGARLDLGDAERALQELDIPELDPDRAFEWSPGLFAARAAVLEELGRADEAASWHRRAVVAADALEEASGLAASEVVFVEEIEEEPDEDAAADDDAEMQEAEFEGPEPEAREQEVDEPDLVVAAVDEPEAASDVAPADSAAEQSIDEEVGEILADAGIREDEEDH